MKLFKALDAGFTAFCNELWLPTFGFHLFDDPADALEEDSVRRRFSESWKSESVDVPVELAGSLSAPGDGPEVGDSPRSAPTSGQPASLSASELRSAASGLLEYSDVSPLYVTWRILAYKLKQYADWLDTCGVK